MRKLCGVYSNLAEAREVTKSLMGNGCGEDDVRIISKDIIEAGKKCERDADDKTLDDYDRSIIDAYRDEIKSGKALVLVGEDIDIEDVARYNVEKEEKRKAELGQDPLDKPYPEKQHYEKEYHEKDEK